MSCKYGIRWKKIRRNIKVTITSFKDKYLTRLQKIDFMMWLSVQQSSTFVRKNVFAAVDYAKSMKLGWNLGNTLDAVTVCSDLVFLRKPSKIFFNAFRDLTLPFRLSVAHLDKQGHGCCKGH